jgi:hypothetical protein
MDLVNLKEKEELNRRAAESIQSQVFDLRASEMKKLLKEKCITSLLQNTKNLFRKVLDKALKLA